MLKLFNFGRGGKPRSQVVEVAEKEAKATFSLCINHLQIGQLWLEDGLWQFEYTRDFKDQSQLEPLFEFPDPNKRYSQAHLWPFFEIRIPSLERNAIKSVIANEGIDEHDQAALLARFGKRTVANPYQLKVA